MPFGTNYSTEHAHVLNFVRVCFITSWCSKAMIPKKEGGLTMVVLVDRTLFGSESVLSILNLLGVVDFLNKNPVSMVIFWG